MLTKADLHVCPDTNEAYLSMIRTGMINRKRLLRLTLRRKPFLEILMGKKKEEYREYTPYWMERLGDKDGPICQLPAQRSFAFMAKIV